MPGTTSTDGDNASCEVNSHSAPRASSHPKWNASEFQCSICYELLLNPVVGSCGHDFCKHCIEEWKVSRQLMGQPVVCPICRAVLLPSMDQSFGVCIRLRETIEKLFPDQVANRRRLAGLAAKSRKRSNDSCPAGLPSSSSPTVSTITTNSSSTSSGTSSATTTTTTTTIGAGATSDGFPRSQHSPAGGAPGPPVSGGTLSPYAFLDLDLLSRAAEQYRELSMLVSAITSVPTPPDAVVQAFTQAAASMADQRGTGALAGQPPRAGVSSGTPAGGPPSTLPPQQAAELAQLFLSSGAALTSTAAAAFANPATQQPFHQQQQHLQAGYAQYQPHPLQHQHYPQAPVYASSAVPLYGYAQPSPAHHRQDHVMYGMDPTAAASTAAAVANMTPSDAAMAATMAAQMASSGPGSGPGGRGSGMASGSTIRSGGSNSGSGGGGFLEAALTLLTSAAATSNAAGQLRTLVTALHHQQQEQQQQFGGDSGSAGLGSEDGRARQAPQQMHSWTPPATPAAAASSPSAAAAAAAGGSAAADDALRSTAHTVQQLTAEAAAMSHLLRMQHQHQLQAHMQAAAHAQQFMQLQAAAQQHQHQQQGMALAAAAQAQAQAQSQAPAHAHAQYLGGPYVGVLAAVAPPQPILVAWGSPPAAPASPFVLLSADPQLQALHPHLHPGAAAASVGPLHGGAGGPTAGPVPAYVPGPFPAASYAFPSPVAPGVQTMFAFPAAVTGATSTGAGTGLGAPAGAADIAATGSSSSSSSGQLCIPLAAAPQSRALGQQPFAAAAAVGGSNGASVPYVSSSSLGSGPGGVGAAALLHGLARDGMELAAAAGPAAAAAAHYGAFPPHQLLLPHHHHQHL